MWHVLGGCYPQRKRPGQDGIAFRAKPKVLPGESAAAYHMCESLLAIGCAVDAPRLARCLVANVELNHAINDPQIGRDITPMLPFDVEA